jgi:hypothetical protein
MSIASSAVLVELNISVWTANKLDKGATDLVLTSNSASSGSAQDYAIVVGQRCKASTY